MHAHRHLSCVGVAKPTINFRRSNRLIFDSRTYVPYIIYNNYILKSQMYRLCGASEASANNFFHPIVMVCRRDLYTYLIHTFVYGLYKCMGAGQAGKTLQLVYDTTSLAYPVGPRAELL